MVLPALFKLPPGLVQPFSWVNIRGNHAYISGHGPQEIDGSPAGPLGALGDTISTKDGYARLELHAACVLPQLHDIHGTGCGLLETQRSFSPRMAFVNKFKTRTRRSLETLRRGGFLHAH